MALTMIAGLESDEARKILWHSILGLEALQLHQLFGHTATIIFGAAERGGNRYLYRASGFGEVDSVDSVNSSGTCDSSRATWRQQVRHAKKTKSAPIEPSGDCSLNVARSRVILRVPG